MIDTDPDSEAVSFQADKVSMRINDNGRGFVVPASWNEAAAKGRLGLLGMRERAQLVQGVVEITSEPGKGTAISLEVPLSAVGVA